MNLSDLGYSKDITVHSTVKEAPAKLRNASLLHAVCKRCLDIVFAFIGLILLSPVFLTISVFYLFGENRGPLIFKQKRVGKNGELFYIYKFRSMIVDADKKLKANKLLYQKYLKNNYKLEPNEDPRITKLGQFLRKTSLDEIPQLINVIKGNMSLVGPRPIVEEELKEYGEKRGLLLSVKPGVTGYWQVNGRSNVGYPERVELELYYVYNCSLILDIKILLLTIKNVILKKGAY